MFRTIFIFSSLVVLLLVLMVAQAQDRLWTGVIGSHDYDEGRGVAIDPLNAGVYVVGTAMGSVDGPTINNINHLLLLKYTSAGLFE